MTIPESVLSAIAQELDDADAADAVGEVLLRLTIADRLALISDLMPEGWMAVNVREELDKDGFDERTLAEFRQMEADRADT